MPELRKRAAAAGVGEDEIEEARDADEPKKEIVKLIVGAAAAQAEAAARQAAAQRAELHALKLPELRKRAAAASISGNAIEEARDADEPKKEMIALIVGQQQGVHP